jgi:VWFA-related protein
VNLLFTVVDSKGHFVNKLRVEDFNLLDDSHPPDAITSFQQESNLPLRVALLIDLSGSISHRFRFEQDAASAFLKKILRPTMDKAFVVGFNQTQHMVIDSTSDVKALAQAVHQMKPSGETALFDALIFASEKLRRNSESGTRRAIILVSDGDDNQSRSKMFQAQEAALRAETPIYTLSTNELDRGEYTKGEAVLELLARYTGGELLPAHDSSSVVKAFRQVEEALRSQYVLAYKPAQFQPDGKYRPIALSARESKFKIECRRGYFAPRN